MLPWFEKSTLACCSQRSDSLTNVIPLAFVMMMYLMCRWGYIWFNRSYDIHDIHLNVSLKLLSGDTEEVRKSFDNLWSDISVSPEHFSDVRIIWIFSISKFLSDDAIELFSLRKRHFFVFSLNLEWNFCRIFKSLHVTRFKYC